MAVNIVSCEDFDLLFPNFVQDILGLKQEQVLISYREKGQPSSVISKDVCYVHTSLEDDQVQIFKNRKKSYDPETENVTITQQAMRRIMLQVVFYGPNSDVLSTMLNEYCYMEDAKQFFYNNDLAFIPSLTTHIDKLYEKINERRWERADLKLRFYNTISVETEVSTITSTDIKIIHEREE